jgi:hypothetical protein
MPAHFGKVFRGHAVLVRFIGNRATSEQKLDHCRVAIRGGKVEGC